MFLSGPGRRVFFPLLVLAPVAVLLAAHWVVDRPELKIVSAIETSPSGVAQPVALPYVADGEPLLYRYDVIAMAPDEARTGLRIIPDDCLRSLTIDGERVPLDRISGEALCDYRGGFELDVGRYLRPGANLLTLEVENRGGPFGLTLTSTRGERASGWRTYALLVALAFASYAAVRGLRMGKWRAVVAAVLVAVAGWLRYRYVFDWHPPESFIFSDMAGYVNHGREIARGLRNADQTFQPIGYPLLLALSLRGCGDFTLACWAHVLAGWATVVLVWRATARWLGRGPGLWALGITALYVPFITLSGFFLAETVFTFQLALLFYCLVRVPFPWRTLPAFAIGLVYMSALWIKGNDTLFGPLALAWIAFWILAHKRAAWLPLMRRMLAPVAAFCFAAALVVASHAAYTRVAYGHVQLSAATGALNFVEGKCPWKRNYDSEGMNWWSPLFVQLGEGQEKHWQHRFTEDRYFWAVGVDCIRDDPWVLATSARYVYYLFFDNSLWPPSTSDPVGLVRASTMLDAALMFPALALGAIVVVHRPRRRAMLFLAMGGSIVLCAWIFKSELRYRVPFDVVFIPIAVLGAHWARARLRRRHPRAGKRAAALGPAMDPEATRAAEPATT